MRDKPQARDQLLERQLAFRELTGDSATVQHDDTVRDRMNVKDIVVDEKAGLTVRNHVSNILTKLQVADRTQAALRAREAGLA